MMSVKFLEDACILNPDREGGLLPFPRTQVSRLIRGAIFHAGEGHFGPEDVLADPRVLNGMESDASFIFYKEADNSLTLVRDAVGATPLFYAAAGEQFIASFELKTLLSLLPEKPKPDEGSLYDFLATHYRYVFRDPSRTFYEGVFQVPAGHAVVLKDGEAKSSNYLDLSYDPEASRMGRLEAAHEYVGLLNKNVLCRLAALNRERFAFTVSSGLDSSSVAFLAARFLKSPLEAWTMSYSSAKGTPYDETPGVRALLRGSDWTLNALEMDAPDLLGEASALMDLTLTPIVTVTWLANYHLSRKAADKGYPYLFSGLGGDESLAGEFEHFFLFFADLRAAGDLGMLERETECWASLHSTPEFPKGPEVRDAYFVRNLDFKTGEIRVDQPRYTQFRDYFEPSWVNSMEKRIPPVPMPTPYPLFLSNRLFQEMSFETSPPTLWSESLSSRAGGVKGIFPLASPRLFRLALSLPGTFKYDDGYTKMILRRGMKGILPDSSRLNPVKTGFNAPLDVWLRDEKTAGDTLNLLLGSPLSKSGWLPKGSLEKIVADHKSGARNNMMLLWPLIQSALFLNKLG
jgi:asparagine synthase (glutamine-hydrolysing)